MKIIHLLLFVCFFTTSKATNYYFSSVSGDDSRTSTQAKNVSTPWKTLSKLNSFFSSLQPGDSILFKRGETFFGSLTVNKSGTSTSPIIIGAFGTGNKPVITSLVTLGNWVSKGGGIWESYNSSLGSVITTVLLNGQVQDLGRYPNSDASNDGYKIFESHSGTTSITDNELTSTINWTGAELVLRTRRWILDRNLITSHSGTKITYSTSSTYEPYNYYGYFIQNSIKTLDKFGEWYYNTATKKLSQYFGSGNPSSYSVQATTGFDLISSSSISNVVFDNLNIKGANNNAFNIKSGSNFYIKNCDISFSGKDGVQVSSQSNFKIENCTISYSNNNAIDLGYSANDAIVRNNKIINTSIYAGRGLGGDGGGIAIFSFGSNNLIEKNQIISTGYIGIHFNGDNVNIKNNLIDSFCVVKDDGAGIYSVIGSDPPHTGRIIQGNIIMHGNGAGPGTDNPAYLPAEGIYMDKNVSDVNISNNTIANCNNNGIYLHNAYNIIMRNNIIYNNFTQMSVIQKEDQGLIRNNVITNNVFFSKIATQMVSYIKSSDNDISLFGKFDSNYYARPLDDRIDIYNSYMKTSTSTVTQKFELEGWQDKYNKDPKSKRSARQIAPYKLSNLIGSNKVSNGGTFTNDVNGVSENACTVALSKSGLLDGGYMQVTPTSRSSTVYMNIGGLGAGKKYILKYSLRGSVDSSMTLSAYLRQGASPYKNLTLFQYRKVALSRTENEMIFVSPSTESSATIVFQADDQTKYYLDNISVYEANATITNPDDSIRFEYNATSVNKTVSLDGNYLDVKNNKYSNSLVLGPYTSIVLLRDGGGTSSNGAPVVKIINPVANASFTSPAIISMEATATDADGSITKVQFYNGSTLLWTETNAPYTYSWVNVLPGNYTIYAKAFDNNGLTTTSAGVSISVNSILGSAPVVILTAPLINTVFDEPASIHLVATATDVGGTITKVDFYNGSTLLHTEKVLPYGYQWKNVAAGSYSISAKATDNSGNVSTSAIVPIIVRPQSSALFSRPSNESLSVADNGTGINANGALLSQDNASKIFDFRLFPNPAKSIVQVYFDGVKNNSQKADLIIQNISGSVLRKIPVIVSGKNVEVDISSLSTGVYIMSLRGNNFVINKKFMKIN